MALPAAEVQSWKVAPDTTVQVVEPLGVHGEEVKMCSTP